MSQRDVTESHAAGSAIDWLVRPLRPSPEIGRRRERLLAWLLASLLILLTLSVVLVLIVDGPANPQRAEYLELIFGLGFLFAVIYLINAAGHYQAAAWLTVAVAALEPWVAMVLDRAIIAGDFVPLLYAVVAVLLASVLLAPWATVLIAVVEFAGLCVVPFITPSQAPFNWSSLLTFAVIVSALGILSGAILQRDVSEIEEQAERLAESEAQLRELSVRDHLTGLFNRRYLAESLERERVRAVRAGEPVGLIMFDLDAFKTVNDRWGHAAGDRVLQQVGRAILIHTRASDIACRCGGDEFVLVMPGASREVSVKRAQELCATVEAQQAELDFLGGTTVTISVGVATFPDDAETSDALLAAADAGLYRAKRAGRDAIFVGDERVQRLGGAHLSGV